MDLVHRVFQPGQKVYGLQEKTAEIVHGNCLFREYTIENINTLLVLAGLPAVNDVKVFQLSTNNQRVFGANHLGVLSFDTTRDRKVIDIKSHQTEGTRYFTACSRLSWLRRKQKKVQ